jgi:hypothetical protein
MSNSAADPITAQCLQSEDARRKNSIALERRLRFEAKHPEVDIRAKRENGGRLAFYVTEPGSIEVAWLDATAMMDDLEPRYDGYNEGRSPDE